MDTDKAIKLYKTTHRKKTETEKHRAYYKFSNQILTEVPEEERENKTKIFIFDEN